MTRDEKAIEAMRLQLQRALNEGKHCAYQQLPSALASLLGAQDYPTHKRYEQERLAFIAEHVSFADRTVLDIGANTGFFSFEALQLGARAVTCYEGWAPHARIIQAAARLLGCETTVAVHDRYFEFATSERFDVALLLNVLHHLGDDFGGPQASVAGRLDTIGRHLRSMAASCDTLVLQMGFNAEGNRDLPLFTHGSKQEMIDFITDAAKGVWSVIAIGIAEVQGVQVRFSSPTEANLRRMDDLGEFLNRPLFVLHREASS